MDDGWETRRINVQFHLNTVTNQSPSQGPLSLSPHGEKERERPWCGLVTGPLDNRYHKGGVLSFQNFVGNIFVNFKERLFGKE